MSTFIPQHGGYRKLITYQRAEIIYDATIYFTTRFLNKRDRTVDQMIQAARSGKQNIAEASMASGDVSPFQESYQPIAYQQKKYLQK